MNKRIKSFRLLCDIISPNLEDSLTAKLREKIGHQKINWEEVVKVANSFYLVPALWYGLESKALIGSIDNEITRYLKDLFLMNRDRNLYLKQELIAFITSLNQKGIEPLLFKGSACLLNNAFADIGIRLMSDLDILIKEEDLPGACEVLKKLGYHTNKELYQAFGNLAPMYRKSSYNYSIELHNTLDKTKVLKNVLTEEAWGVASKQRSDSLAYNELSPEFKILYHIVHTEMQDGNYAFNAIDLRRLHDFAFNMKQLDKTLDWSELQQQMIRFGLFDCFSSYLLLSNKFFGVKLAKNIPIPKTATIHYLKVNACIRWKIIAVLIRTLGPFISKFSSGKIIKQYGCKATFLAVNICRIRRVGLLIIKYSSIKTIKKLIRYKTRYY